MIIKKRDGSVLCTSDKSTLKEAIVEAVAADANLRDVDLVWADLRDVDLRGADLRGADLRGANLRGANLVWADLRDATFLLQGLNTPS